MKKINERGITLVSLVITIIVMLILAGVSLNMVMGDNSVLKQAQKATFASKISSYREAFDLKVAGMLDERKLPIKKETITAYEPSKVKEYINNLDDSDLEKFKILRGEIYYVGNDPFEKEVAIEQNMKIDYAGLADEIEKNAIEVIIHDMRGEAFTVTSETGDVHRAGVPLKDKNLFASDWKIIMKFNGKKVEATYGTGWYFVNAGTKTDQLGVLKKSYILNYDTKTAVEYDESVHRQLAWDSNLAVTRNLILNIDPKNMTEDESSWGDVKLFGFNKAGEKDASGKIVSGWFGSGIRLDGKDDYIEFSSGSDFEKGFTLTFYGKQMSSSIPFFCKQNPGQISRSIRFYSMYSGIQFNVSKNEANSAWSGSNENNGILTCSWPRINQNDDVYIDVVCDPVSHEEGKIIYAVYRDGKKVGETTTDRSYWYKTGSATYAGKDLMESVSETCRIGSSYGGNPALWGYGNFDIYTVRLYNDVLSDLEIEENYKATVAYHSTLTKPDTGETGGETGGEDFENAN